jgi:hypothetical protein
MVQNLSAAFAQQQGGSAPNLTTETFTVGQEAGVVRAMENGVKQDVQIVGLLNGAADANQQQAMNQAIQIDVANLITAEQILDGDLATLSAATNATTTS